MQPDQLREAFSHRDAQAPTFQVDPDELIRRGRRASRRRTLVLAASCVAIAVIVTVTGVIISTGPKPGGSVSITTVTPSPAVSRDFEANLYPHCRVRLLDAALAEPFWLGNDHFDPPGNRRTAHTASEVLQAYRTNPVSRTVPSNHLQVAFAAFSQTNPAARPVWIVVTNNIPNTRPSSTSFMDYVAIFDDRDHLQYLGTIGELLPRQCQ